MKNLDLSKWEEYKDSLRKIDAESNKYKLKMIGGLRDRMEKALQPVSYEIENSKSIWETYILQMKRNNIMSWYYGMMESYAEKSEIKPTIEGYLDYVIGKK